MKIEDLRLLNDEELEEYKKSNPAHAMHVARHYRWLYQTKIDALRKLGREDLIPEYEKKLEEIGSVNDSGDKGTKPKPRPRVSKETKGTTSEVVPEVGTE